MIKAKNKPKRKKQIAVIIPKKDWERLRWAVKTHLALHTWDTNKPARAKLNRADRILNGFAYGGGRPYDE